MRGHIKIKILGLSLAILILACHAALPAAWAVTDPPPQAQGIPGYDGYEAAKIFEYWREYKIVDLDIVYTIDPNDVAWHEANSYTYSPTSWYISPIQVPPLIPLYRLWNSSSTDHLFTTNPGEVASAVAQGFTLEGIIGYVAPLGVTLPQTRTIKRTWYPYTCHSLQYADFSEPIMSASGYMPLDGQMNPLIRPEGPVFQAFIPHNVHKPVVGVPGAPTGLSAKLFRAEEVDLSWNNVSNRATGIKVQRKKAPHTFYTTIATLDPDQTSYTDEVDVDEKYSYRVVAFNEYGDSAPTNSVDISTVFPAPKAPSDLTAEIRDKKWVKLNWRDNSNDEIYFLIERKSEGSNFTEIAYLSSNVTTYNDYGVESGKTYTYRMSCYNGLKSSAHSQAVSVTIPTVFLPGGSAPGGVQVIEAGLPPKAASDLKAVAGGEQSVLLQWSDNANNETGYRVYRSTLGEFLQIDNVPANTTTYLDDQGIVYGETYRYMVVAYNDAGESWSNEDEVTIYGRGSTETIIGVFVPQPLPEAPGALQSQAASATSALLSWQDNSSHEDGFELERKTAGGPFQKIGVFPAGAVSYIDTGLAANTRYTYRIRSFNSAGYSAYSGETSITIIGGGSVNIMLPSQSGSSQSGYTIPGQTGYTIPGQGQSGYTIPGSTGSTGNTNTGNLPTGGSGAKSPETGAQATIVLTVDQADYSVNGQPRQMDATPVIIENRTMLPVRAVVEALGGTMAWDPAQQKATAALGDKTVAVRVGSATAEANGQALQIDPGNPRVMPVIVPPGRTLLPLRFITENLGCGVEWDPAARTITIRYPDVQ